MIPHLLQLKNFLSYGPEEQTISFTPYHLICLSGKNGHGKSAMLDAITWAIWGQARKTVGNAKADEGLMHLGQKYMFVRLDFEVNGQLYRVRREYIKTASKPLALLDFGILKEKDSISPLTDKTIKLTQAKIEKTIGLTYESFVNSAFLKQGESNSFSKKTPLERKEILATILNLNQFELLKKSALERVKTIQQQHQSHLYILEKIEEEIVSLADVHEQRRLAEIELQELAIKEAASVQEAAEQQAQLILLQKHTHEKKFFEQELDQVVVNGAEWSQKIKFTEQLILISDSKNRVEQLDELEKEKTTYHTLIEQIHAQGKKEIEQKEAYFALKEKNKEAEYKNNLIKEQEREALRALEEKEKELAAGCAEQEKILSNIKILEIEKKKLDFEQSLQTKIEEQIIEQTKEYNLLYAQGAGYHQKLQELEHQILYFAAQNTKIDCLLCEQSIDPYQQEPILYRLQENKKSIAEQLAKTKEVVTKLQQDLKILKAKQAEMQSEQNRGEQINFKWSEYQNQLSKVDQQKNIIMHQIQAFQAAIQTMRAQFVQLNSQDNAKLKELEDSILLIQAERKDYNIYREKLSLIEEKIKCYHQAQQLQSEQKQLLKDLDTLKTSLLVIDNHREKLIDTLKKYQHLADTQAFLQNQQLKINQASQELQIKKNKLLTLQGSLMTKQERQKTLTKNKIHYQEIIAKLQSEINDYQAIAKALGKDGIQALLIEEALPEIEEEANKLLARLTNNQTQIFIESLRDLKKGGNKETLDIKIADNMGIRPYEMFSGGEAFRIDFALRIAIAKLVARHAGTTLQTICIDEGFGSQDEEGLQLIMDSIYKIQNDFAKVIIVSHLPSMKEQFPVQFLIQKKASGTHVTVVEQG